jgi:hypothetical protein
MSIASARLCGTAGDSHLRTGDCRCPDTVRECAADRSDDFICSGLFKRFWRMCSRAFLTAPYKNCTLWNLSSAQISGTSKRARRWRARLSFTIRSQSRSSSWRRTQLTMWRTRCANRGATEYRLRPTRGTRCTQQRGVDDDRPHDVPASDMRRDPCVELRTMRITSHARILPKFASDSCK